jgi:hypothetical protein
MAADRALFIGWNRSERGKEKQALEAFSSALAYYGKLVQTGQIESFEPVILNPHGGDLNGFILIRGTADKLAAVQDSDEFRDLTTLADMSVGGIGVIGGFVGEGVVREIARFQRHIR